MDNGDDIFSRLEPWLDTRLHGKGACHDLASRRRFFVNMVESDDPLGQRLTIQQDRARNRGPVIGTATGNDWGDEQK